MPARPVRSRHRLVVHAGSLAAAALIAALALGPAIVADTPEPAPAGATDPLATARQAIAEQRWPAAIAELRRVRATASADWNNLMGYALRKQARPDLDGAQRYYDAALRIDPQHRGALEYAGELALTKGDLPRAEAHLATLARVCPDGCEERTDLEQAIARFKAAGGRAPG